MNATIVVPVKDFGSAKRRMAPILSDAQRKELAQTMLCDVLEVACAAVAPVNVLVVSAEPDVCGISDHFGARLLKPQRVGLNGAITDAAALLSNERRAMIVVPGDVPQISAEVLKGVLDLLAGHEERTVILARAGVDGGTNIFACNPPDIIVPLFGKNSFHHHCVAAIQSGANLIKIDRAECLYDIDRPEDLDHFLQLTGGKRTHRFLEIQGLVDIDHRLNSTKLSHERSHHA